MDTYPSNTRTLALVFGVSIALMAALGAGDAWSG